MAMPQLAEVEDVRELFPASFDPGVNDEQITRLIVKAGALLRQRAPWVDRRMDVFNRDPFDASGLDPLLVASVVATVVKRFLINPSGATNESETVGPYSRSTGYALRGDKDVRGELAIVDSDIAKLRRPRTVTPYFGSARLASGLAPPPDGDAGVGPLGSGSAVTGWITPPRG